MKNDRARLSPRATALLAALVLAAMVAYFMFIDLTQKETVISMFVCLGIAAAFWFYKKPWK